MMANSHTPSPYDLDLNTELTIDDIIPPLDADASAILNPKSLSVAKSGLETCQIDPNPIGFSQSESQLIETRLFKSSLKLRHDSVDLDTTPKVGHIPKSHGSSGSPVLWTDVSNFMVISEGDEKKKSRKMRNKESARLSRERKKHYHEELEDKVRKMHSTIKDLNLKISHLTLENATLRSQMGSIGVPSLIPPPPGMYYPWMHYMVKPQGSQVPLVPIPRLKPQAVAPSTKRSKKVENKE